MRVVVVPMYPREFRFGRKTTPNICRGWNTHFGFDNSGNSIQEGTLNTFPNFSKTYPGAFPVPFDFRPEISKILVEWKAPLVALTLKFRTHGEITDSDPE